VESALTINEGEEEDMNGEFTNMTRKTDKLKEIDPFLELGYGVNAYFDFMLQL
jgi:hypothetical protein